MEERTYYEKHRESKIEYALSWNKENKDKVKEYKKKYRNKEENKIKQAEYNRKWRAKKKQEKDELKDA